MAGPIRIFAFRLSSRGETPARQPQAPDPGSLCETAGHVRPFAFGRLDDSARIGQKSRARLLTIEKIEPLSADCPNQGMALHRPATPDRERIVTAETRYIHVRMAHESTSIPLVRETPDRSVEIQFDLPTAK